MSDSSHSEGPTERQLKYARDLGASVPADASKGEVSDLIQARLDGDEPASDLDRLLAETHEISITRFTGKKAIHSRIFHGLDLPGQEHDLVRWFARFVYIDLTGDEGPSPPVDKVVQTLASDAAVVASVKRYRSWELLRFGTWTDTKGTFREGGSRRTIAYKKVSAALSEELGIEPKKKRSRGAGPSTAADSRSGCLSLVAFACLVAVTVFVSLLWW